MDLSKPWYHVMGQYTKGITKFSIVKHVGAPLTIKLRGGVPLCSFAYGLEVLNPG